MSIIKTSIIVVLASLSPYFVSAGNPDRSGQAGASELLINPWAKSSGWGTASIGGVRGVEALYGNVAGIAFTKGTEISFTNTNWLKGSDISINAFGLTQKVGESGTFGISATTMSLGTVDITTTDNPEGGIGTYSANFTNVSVAYAKEFSHSIYGGFNVKGISESISNLSAYGMALDAGIQYVTGKRDEVKLGITLKNVGPAMRFSGDGLYQKATNVVTGQSLSFNYRVEQFELPASLNMGASYDFVFSELHRLTVSGVFVSNSFSQDNFVVGAEYGFLTYLSVRGGYTYFGKDNYTGLVATTFRGPSAGFSIDAPIGKSGINLGVDYSYRATNYFDGVHSIGTRLTF